jgi:hypothetical protein
MLKLLFKWSPIQVLLAFASNLISEVTNVV